MRDANLSEISAPHNDCTALKEWKNVTWNTPTNFNHIFTFSGPCDAPRRSPPPAAFAKNRSRLSSGLEYQGSTLSPSLACTRGWILFRVQVLLFALLASARSHLIPQQVIFNYNWCASKRITFINLIKACQSFNGRYYFGWESVGEEIKSLWHEEALKPFKTQRAHCGGHGTRSYLSNKCQVHPTRVCVLTVSLTLS